MTPLAWTFDKAIAVYQAATARRPSPCRHVPSCSVYGREAVQSHGALRGGWLTVRRLGRCHPWGTQGHDPVPPRRSGGRVADHPADGPGRSPTASSPDSLVS